MNSQQYEELCRYFLADKFGIEIRDIESVNIPNPRRFNKPEYKHQIDLYWETGVELSLYLHIANAKWRGSAKVGQQDVLLLQKVKEKVAAHKAMILTNQGFTKGAKAVAEDDEIALHILKPSFDVNCLPAKNREAMQAKFQEISATQKSPIYSYEIVYRAFDLDGSNQAQQTGAAPISTGYQTRVQKGYTTRVGGGGSNKAVTAGGRQISTETRGGGNVTKGGGFNKR